MSYVASWSGGKDSCLAYHRAVLDGYKISHLVNFISKEYKRVSFHGTEARLIQLQAESIGVSLFQRETQGTRYEEDFKNALNSLISNGVKGMIFGDIYLQEHKDWVERVCGELGIEAVEPLWGESTEKIFFEFIDSGFEAMVVSAKKELFDEKWIGQKLNRDFLSYLKDKNIDIYGEDGEYHTFVANGPIFKKKIEINKTRSIKRNEHWFLDTINYSGKQK